MIMVAEYYLEEATGKAGEVAKSGEGGGREGREGEGSDPGGWRLRRSWPGEDEGSEGGVWGEVHSHLSS